MAERFLDRVLRYAGPGDGGMVAPVVPRWGVEDAAASKPIEEKLEPAPSVVSRQHARPSAKVGRTAAEREARPPVRDAMISELAPGSSPRGVDEGTHATELAPLRRGPPPPASDSELPLRPPSEDSVLVRPAMTELHRPSPERAKNEAGALGESHAPSSRGETSATSPSAVRRGPVEPVVSASPRAAVAPPPPVIPAKEAPPVTEGPRVQSLRPRRVSPPPDPPSRPAADRGGALVTIEAPRSGARACDEHDPDAAPPTPSLPRPTARQATIVAPPARSRPERSVERAATGDPKLEIGRIDVFIEAPEPTVESRHVRGERAPVSSRRYLRRP